VEGIPAVPKIHKPNDNEDGRMLLKLQEAAKKLAISRSLLHRWIGEGRIACVILGKGPRGNRIVRVRPEAVEKFIIAREKESAAPNVRMKSNRKWEAS
jgi:predicted site-specific integrase-resolvase